jgi:hypothetical protein
MLAAAFSGCCHCRGWEGWTSKDKGQEQGQRQGQVAGFVTPTLATKTRAWRRWGTRKFSLGRKMQKQKQGQKRVLRVAQDDKVGGMTDGRASARARAGRGICYSHVSHHRPTDEDLPAGAPAKTTAWRTWGIRHANEGRIFCGVPPVREGDWGEFCRGIEAIC